MNTWSYYGGGPAYEELSYRDLLDAVRHKTAIDLMQDTANTVTDITNLLGYTDLSHFARAFRRMAGVSPREYLQQYPTKRRMGKGTK